MRAHLVFLIASTTGVASLLGCMEEPSQGQSFGPTYRARGDDNDQSDEPGKPAKPGGASKSDAGGACSLAKAGFTFESKGKPGGTCDQCIEAACCDVVVDCFGKSADCRALHDCVVTCSRGGAPPSGGGGPSGSDAGTSVARNAKPQFVAEVYPALQPTCATCHATGQQNAPIFFGATADATYTQFEARGFTNDASILNKGQHAGPALTATQTGIVQRWLAAEQSARAAAGPGTTSDAGTADPQLCFDACYAQHAASSALHKQFLTCRTQTCGERCK